jgi:hypothetical protein
MGTYWYLERQTQPMKWILMGVMVALGLVGCRPETQRPLRASEVDQIRVAARRSLGSKSLYGDWRLQNSTQDVPARQGQRSQVLTGTQRINGPDHHVISVSRYTPPLPASLNHDERGEAMVVAGRTYQHGPSKSLNLKEDRWYVQPETFPPLEVLPPWENVLQAITKGDVDVAAFQITSEEQLDGQLCQVVESDQAAQQWPDYAQILASPSVTLKDAHFRLWYCADEYIHQIQLGIRYVIDTDPTEENYNHEEYHLYRFDHADPILAPASPLPRISN